MKPLTAEWVEKAEGDFVVVQRELRARKSPNYDAVAFHAQQCAEKYLKARLQEAHLRFPRTHDLRELLTLLLPLEPKWIVLFPAADLLSRHAVLTRYPGVSVTRVMARELRDTCREFRAAAREALGLPV